MRQSGKERKKRPPRKLPALLFYGAAAKQSQSGIALLSQAGRKLKAGSREQWIPSLFSSFSLKNSRQLPKCNFRRRPWVGGTLRENIIPVCANFLSSLAVETHNA